MITKDADQQQPKSERIHKPIWNTSVFKFPAEPESEQLCSSSRAERIYSKKNLEMVSKLPSTEQKNISLSFSIRPKKRYTQKKAHHYRSIQFLF